VSIDGKIGLENVSKKSKEKEPNKTAELLKKIRKPMPPSVRRHKSIKDYDRRREKEIPDEEQ